jgi:hypothetical protein
VRILRAADGWFEGNPLRVEPAVSFFDAQRHPESFLYLDI